jgi:hypothetical protein
MALSLTAVTAGTTLAHSQSSVAAGRPGHHHKHHRHHKARKLSFRATVVRATASGLVLRASNGKLLSFSTNQIRAGSLPGAKVARARLGRAASDLTFSSGGVVINVRGLQPGTIVEVTETIAGDGSITITITLPPGPSSEQAVGVVTDVESDSFTMLGADGAPLVMHMTADQLSKLDLQTCQRVDVTYHSDGGVLIAESVTTIGTSSDGSCAPTTDTSGVVTQVSDDGLTVSTDQGPVTFSVDPSSGLTAGFQPGDLVDVTSTANPDGSLTAIDICFVEENVSGSVTAVTTSTHGGSLTVQDDDSGNLVTVYADPTHGVEIDARAFNGVSAGDTVAVTYHQSAGQLIADTVSDQ